VGPPFSAKTKTAMSNVSQRSALITHKFADDGRIPNNAALPFVL